MASRKGRSSFGHLFRRKDRQGFYLRVRSGKKEIIRYAGPDRRTAEEVRADTLRKIRREELLGERSIATVSLREFEPALLRHLEAKHSSTTVASDRGRLKKVLEWFGSKPMKDIGPGEVQDFLTHLRTDEGLTVATLNRYAAVLSVAFKLAQAKAYASQNPVRGLERGREQQRPIPYVSRADVDRLVEAAPDKRFGALLRVLADTGIRRSEALALEWRDVHLARRRIVVRQSKNRGTREIDLTGEAMRALRNLSEERKAIPLKGPDLVWAECATKGPDAVSSRFRTVARRAGLAGLRLHDLRHGYCSRLAQAGVPLPTIMALAGHTAWATTQRYASHIPEGATRAAIQKLERHERKRPRRSPRSRAQGIQKGIQREPAVVTS